MLYIVGIWLMMIIGIAGMASIEYQYAREMELYEEDYE